ncbi:MAG: cobalt ECF transporter T component CbiQ [Lachnospiraceae bacterium]|nr:cobalt ECF transporter T component CbiQ [Lachnospiraceae bacterium]
MNKIDYAIMEIHHLDHEAKKENILTRINPLAKLIITFLYIILLTSIDRYKPQQCIYMCIYLILIKIIGEISMKKCIKRLKVIFTIVLVIGIANPIINRNIVAQIGKIPISSGMISMTTLMIKGCFAIIASYFFIITTGMENFCVALRMIHIPGVLITVILLIYRYIIVFLKEVQRIWTAYSMRAPNQKGVNFKAWGSMIGSLMIRSIDKAGNVYDSMELRGFNPDTFFDKKNGFCEIDLIYFIFSAAVIVVIRYINIFEMIGNVFVFQ